VSTTRWQLGDPPGRRQFIQLFDAAQLQLELGRRLGPVTVAYETWGTPARDRSNAILIEHPARMTHARVAGSTNGVAADLVRLSVGLETTVDLVADLRQALDGLT
jgi:homoserine acetyltransferase